MVVIKQSFKAFLTKHKLDDAPAAARADDDDDYQQGKIESVALETGYRSSPRAREKFMISAEGQPARAPPAPSAPADAGSWTAGDAGVANPAEPAEAYRVVHAVVMVRARPSTLAPRVGIKRAGDVVRGRVLKMASTDNEWLKLDGAVGYVLLHGRSVGCGELLRREAEAAASEAAPAEAPEAAEADGRRLGEARFTVAKDWKERLARAVAPEHEPAAPAAAARAPVNTKAAPSRKAAAARAPVNAKAAPSRKAAAARAPAAGAGGARRRRRQRWRARDPLGVYVWRRALAYAGCARTLGAAACCSDVRRARGARRRCCWWPGARARARDAATRATWRWRVRVPERDRAGPRRAGRGAARGGGRPRRVPREDRAPHAALFALRRGGRRRRVRRDRVSKGGPIGASWRRFRGRARVGDCFAKFAAIAEQRVPFMDRNLCDKLPCSVVIAPYAEARRLRRRAKWVFEGPAWDADAPEPRDLAAAGTSPASSRARAAETFTWPPELRPADCDAVTLEGEFVSGTFVLQAAVASPRHRVRVALALAPCE
ncbi:microtubule-associated protein [Aureococcus anophagefferens]|uniref:Microtubule-associated protein n=1 Tax=Aureococcus anophagefferens TaxID=44056 RepID=A0ABR1GC77_AURAN